MAEVEPGHYAACWYSLEEQHRNFENIGGGDRKVRPEKTISDEKCIEVEHLTKSFDVYKGLLQRKVGSFSALEDISFYARKGETLGIVGESGCGKTTLAKCIMRMLKPDGGKIEFFGENIAEKRQKELRHIRSDISMVFQDPFSSLDGRQKMCIRDSRYLLRNGHLFLHGGGAGLPQGTKARRREYKSNPDV